MRNWPGATLVCVCAIGLLGISRPEADATPTAPDVTNFAVATGDNAISGIALVPSVQRLFATHFAFQTSASSGAADDDAFIDVYAARSLAIVGRVSACHGPKEIAANDSTQRVVVICNSDANGQGRGAPATVIIVDAASLNVISRTELAGPIVLAPGGKLSPYAYALTQNQIVRIVTITGGTVGRPLPQTGLGSDYRSFSVSSEPPERLTLYSDRTAATLDFDSSASPVVHDFGRERYPAASMSVDGFDDVALAAAGTLESFDAGGRVEREPICNAPVELFWNAVVRRLITVCSPLEPGDRIDIISSDAAGSDRRKLSLDDGALIRMPPVAETRAAAQDPLSGRFVVAGSESVHVIDPAGPEQLYQVDHPGFATGLTLDEASGMVFVAFASNGSGGGVLRFNLRDDKPKPPERLRKNSAGGVTAMFVLPADFAALPARVDPPGIRSPAQLAALRDGTFVIRERLSPAVGHLTGAAYTLEPLATTHAAIAMLSGRDGNLWFVELPDGARFAFARHEPGGRITEFSIGSPRLPRELVASLDRLYWLDLTTGHRLLGHLRYDGHLSWLSIPAAASGSQGDWPIDIAGDRRGGVWMVSSSRLSHVDAGGRWKRYPELPIFVAGGTPRLFELDGDRVTVVYAPRLFVVSHDETTRVYFPGLGLPPTHRKIESDWGPVDDVSAGRCALG
jgi:hypothetical protein